MSKLVSAVIAPKGKKGAFVFGGPKRFYLYTGSIGPVRDLPPGENVAEYIGSLDALDKQFSEARQDNAITREEHELLIEVIKRARAKQKV